LTNSAQKHEVEGIGVEMYQTISALYPFCRSITGNGTRETIKHIGTHIPIDVHEVASGTKVFDWTVPREWNIRGAYIRNPKGETIVDFERSNLHVMSYSVPFTGRLPLEKLREHLFTLPEHPDWIPYRTSYYKEDWAFCIPHRQFLSLPEGEYEVCIDSSLRNGHLTYGECFIQGKTQDEVLISCHVCHPSICNDNLSGIALAIALAKHLRQEPHHYSYRFLFIPGTIGSITWLALNEERVNRIKHGLVLAGVGDDGSFTYKKTRRGNAEIDRVFSYVLAGFHDGSRTIDFHPYGYDERQFCSPGFNLPVGCAMRTPFGEYPEYHTSADNLSFVKTHALSDSFKKCVCALEILDRNGVYLNMNPKCEPQLGKRGLYQASGGQSHKQFDAMALFWVLSLSDGMHSLLDIAERSGLAFESINTAAQVLIEHHLLTRENVAEASTR